jgi:hypothetical protein
MCKTANADTFIMGPSGKDYIIKERFEEEGVKYIFHHFVHPVYSQLHGDFIPNMSFIDLLFNHGEDEAIKILGKSSYKIN